MIRQERDWIRARNRLHTLYARNDPNLGQQNILIIRELFKTENERLPVVKEKLKLCNQLAEHAWYYVQHDNLNLSYASIARSLGRIYQSTGAVEYYGQLLRTIIDQLCAKQKEQINAHILESDNLHLLSESWNKHNRNVKFLIDYFIPCSIEGNSLKESLKKTAITAYRQAVLVESNLRVHVLQRCETGKMSRDEQIAAIQVLNAVDDQFFNAHLGSTLLKFTQLFVEILENGATTAELVSEMIYLLEQEQTMFEVISVDVLQTSLFMQKLREHVVKRLLIAHLKDNFSSLVNANEFYAIKQLYDMFNRVEDGIKELIEMVANYIKQKKTKHSSKSASSPKSPARAPLSVIVISDFLAFKSFLFNSLLNYCFSGEKRFRDRIENELHRLVTAQEHFPQYLAFYIDYHLKRKQHDDVTRGADLLRYIDNDESFEQFYRGHLGNRLINGTPSDLAIEKALVERFKNDNGVIYVHKMEKMIADIGISRDLLGEFVQEVNSNPIRTANVANSPPPLIQGVQFTATVLTENHWPPHYRPIKCRLPPLLSSIFTSFEQFYLAKHSGRKLQLNMGAGSAVLTAHFYGTEALKQTLARVAAKDNSVVNSANFQSATKKSLIVTPVQVVIFDLFNDRSYITVQDLLSLEVPSKLLQRALLPMVKLHILQRQGGTVPNFEPESSDVYFVNDEFRSKKPIINLRKNVTAKD